MLPFLMGMLAPSALGALGITGIAPWLAGGMGALAGDLLDDGEINPMNVIGGALGAGMGGGIGNLFGGGAGAAGAAGAGAGLASSTNVVSGPMLSSMRPIARGAAGAAGAAAPAASGIGGLLGGMGPGGLMAGATLLSGLGGTQGGEADSRDRQWRSQAPAPGPNRPTPVGADYVPGVSPERNYGIQMPTIDETRDRYLARTAGRDGSTYRPRYGMGGRVGIGGLMPRYAEGGEVSPSLDTSMPEVQNAIAAIMGDPNVNPEQAMGALYMKLRDQYGEEEADRMIKELVTMVQGGGDRRMPEAGGPDGMADDQMAMIDGQEPARINSGEVVVSNPTLSAMGSGDPDKGADKLMAFMDDVRKEHYGTKKHPKPVDFEGMAAGMA